MIDEHDSLNPSPEGDEVSLLDLMVVLLKHRRLIIVPLLCTIGLSLGVYLLYPAYNHRQAVEHSIAEFNVTVSIDPAIAAILGKEESSKLLIQDLTDPITILSALREAGFDELSDGTRLDTAKDEELLVYISQVLVQESGSASGKAVKPERGIYSVVLRDGFTTLVFRDNNTAKVKQFFSALIPAVNTDIAEYIQLLAKYKLEAYVRLLSNENPGEFEELEITKGYGTYKLIKAYLEDKKMPLSIIGDPFVVQPDISIASIKKDICRKSVLIIFAIAFILILAAFVLQYIENVRKDPASMAKIHEALKKP